MHLPREVLPSGLARCEIRSVPHDAAPPPRRSAAPSGPSDVPPGSSDVPPGPSDVRPRRSAPWSIQTGAVAWGLGLLFLVPIPLLNLLLSGVTQVVVGRSLRGRNAVARENGRRALNWGLTQVTWFILPLIDWALSSVLTANGATPTGSARTVLIVGSIVVGATYVLLCVTQFLYSVHGLVRATSGRIAKLPAIPFVRRERAAPVPVPPAQVGRDAERSGAQRPTAR